MGGLEGTFDMEEFERRNDLFNSPEVIDRVNKRYKECDTNGHKEIVDNRCMHCYRHKTYGIHSPFLKVELEEQIKFAEQNPMNVTMDAPIWFDRLSQDRSFQELLDYIDAQGMIAKELYPNDFSHIELSTRKPLVNLD